MGCDSSMPRFFISPEEIADGKITLSGEDAKHIIYSLRTKPGEKFTLCDGLGKDYMCEFESADSSTAFFKILETRVGSTEPDIDVSLYMALVKSDKFEFIVQKCTELGVKRIIPVLTERCISRPDGKSDRKKIERRQKIAREAAMQSGRGIIPEICETISFDEALSDMKDDEMCFMCYENERKTSLNSLLSDKIPKSISFMVGPEGGFSENEASKASAAGITSVTLGPRILRAETAPLCALSALMYGSGNLS